MRRRRFAVLLIVSLWLVQPCGIDGPVVAADTQDPAVAQSAAPAVPTAQQLAEERELIRLLADTLEQVRANYVRGDVSERELVEAAIRGMMTKLDPYSDYIDPTEFRQFNQAVEHEFVGIGVQVGERDGRIQIISPLFGTPAWRAGLRAGDRILTIGDTSTQDMSIDDTIQLMSGEPGTDVTVSVLHRGAAEPTTVTLKRELIHQPTVVGYRRNAEGVWDYFCDADKKIGYLRLSAFSRTTAEELARALTELQSQDMHGLVLDMRFNPGGMLKQAIEVSDLFLHEGRIVSIVGRAGSPPPWDARDEGTLIPQGFPLAVLVNRFSASAAEIVSACLQDHQAAVIVGERTWGKGSVQNIIELEKSKSALKLTTAGYQRPSGKNIHRAPGATEEDQWGVTPDEGYTIMYSDMDMLQLGMRFTQLDALADQTPPDGELGKAVAAASAEFVDRQLEKALDFLRGRIQPPAPDPDPAPAPAPAPDAPSETIGS